MKKFDDNTRNKKNNVKYIYIAKSERLLGCYVGS